MADYSKWDSFNDSDDERLEVKKKADLADAAQRKARVAAAPKPAPVDWSKVNLEDPTTLGARARGRPLRARSRAPAGLHWERASTMPRLPASRLVASRTPHLSSKARDHARPPARPASRRLARGDVRLHAGHVVRAVWRGQGEG
jgi:hypothetical protein